MVSVNSWAVRRAVGCGAVIVAGLLVGCNNNPWQDDAAASNTLYSAVIENSPRHLDPTASYWSNDTPYTYQIYEPPYAYHYLKRPFQLTPKSAREVVKPYYVDKNGQRLPDDAPAEMVAESIYDVPIKPGILYQPHPALAKDDKGNYVYHAMKPGELGERRTPLDFEHQGTRELVAEDFVYALKRQATTRITAPIFSTFAEYVVGLKEYGELVKLEDAKLRQGLDKASQDKPFLDFRRWPLAGASAPEKQLLRIRIKGKYPQWNYWMQMTFMAPVPWEADAFYAQPGMAERALTLDTWPVGTGAYMMVEYVKDRYHVMKRNPNYRGEAYPCEGMPRRQRGRPARRLRQDDALHRHLGLEHRARGRASARQVPPGLLRRRSIRAHRHRHGLSGRDARLGRSAQRVPRQGFPARALLRRQQLLHRLQHARPDDR